jgi:hypothetical protein
MGGYLPLKPTAGCQISTLIFEFFLRRGYLYQSLTSVKGPGNIFYSNPRWARILPSLIYFSRDVHRDPSPTFFFHSSNLVFDTIVFVKD